MLEIIQVDTGVFSMTDQRLKVLVVDDDERSRELFLRDINICWLRGPSGFGWAKRDKSHGGFTIRRRPDRLLHARNGWAGSPWLKSGIAGRRVVWWCTRTCCREGYRDSPRLEGRMPASQAAQGLLSSSKR